MYRLRLLLLLVAFNVAVYIWFTIFSHVQTCTRHGIFSISPSTTHRQIQPIVGEAAAVVRRAFQAHAHAQFHEDIHLFDWYPHFARIADRTIVESGALDGIRFSSTFAFERVLNWTAIHIEASPVEFQKLRSNRPTSVNINAALCSSSSVVHWVMNPPHPAVSGVWEFMTDRFRRQWYSEVPQGRFPNRTKVVACRSVSDIVSELGVLDVDVWILDVEGAEVSVLRGVEWDSFSPRIIVKEYDPAHPEREQEAFELLSRKGYSRMEIWGRSSWYVNTHVS